ncbi:hypothetical protein AAG906_039895 [Vitis piasezkii]
MSIEDLIIRLRIEEDNRRSEKKGLPRQRRTTTKGKDLSWDLKEGSQRSHKSLIVDAQKNKPKEANVIDDITRNVSDIDLTAIVSEVNLVGSNPKEWWIDTGATRHNLVSGSLLNNHGFRLVFDSNKVVLSKSGMYVGKGYMSDGMWKLNDEAIEKFVLYKTEVENQLNKKIKVLRSDRGGEYESPFVDICAQHGIIHETTAPYSPQSNGVAERKNRTLKEMMNAMLISSSLPQNMWGEAILTANYLLNKVPKKKAEKTPYELWKGRKPSYTYLRMWGCLAKVAVPPPKKVKIGPKTIDCIFIGYAHNSNAYRFLVYESNIPDIHKNTIMESRNASFFEDVFPCKSKKSQVHQKNA